MTKDAKGNSDFWPRLEVNLFIVYDLAIICSEMVIRKITKDVQFEQTVSINSSIKIPNKKSLRKLTMFARHVHTTTAIGKC